MGGRRRRQGLRGAGAKGEAGPGPLPARPREEPRGPGLPLTPFYRGGRSGGHGAAPSTPAAAMSHTRTPRPGLPHPGGEGLAGPTAAPHSLDDPCDGGSQESRIEVPQHRQPPLLGGAVQAHVTQQRGRRRTSRGRRHRLPQRQHQQQPPQLAPPRRCPPHGAGRGHRRSARPQPSPLSGTDHPPPARGGPRRRGPGHGGGPGRGGRGPPSSRGGPRQA